jgi:ADP-ribose pyrophosphatase
MEPIMKIIDAAVLAKHKFVTLFAVTYLDRKGHTKHWHMVSRGDRPKCITGDHQRPDAAIIVPYHLRANKLVVIREYRVPIGAYQYGFPAGLLDPGEPLEVSAGRELHEETGLNLVRIYRHSPAVFSSAGITDESISLVYAEVDGTPNIQHASDSEDIEIFLMDPHQVRDLLRNRQILFGARAWLVMDAFSQTGKTYLVGD